MIRRISVCVHGRNDTSDDVAGTRTGGGGRPAVSERTPSTLRTKKVAKPSAVWSVAQATSRCRPSSVDNERQSAVDERPHSSRRSRQYSSFLRRPRTGDQWRCPSLSPTFSVKPRRQAARRATNAPDDRQYVAARCRRS